MRNTTGRSGRNDIPRRRLTERFFSREKPEVIGGEQQNRLYIERLEKLTAKKSVTPAEKKLVALLTVLIEEYEAKHDPVPEAEPTAIIRHLMEARNLRQKDLLDVFRHREHRLRRFARQARAHQTTHPAAGAQSSMCHRLCSSRNINSRRQ